MVSCLRPRQCRPFSPEFSIEEGYTSCNFNRRATSSVLFYFHISSNSHNCVAITDCRTAPPSLWQRCHSDTSSCSVVLQAYLPHIRICRFPLFAVTSQQYEVVPTCGNSQFIPRCPHSTDYYPLLRRRIKAFHLLIRVISTTNIYPFFEYNC